jgi:hypothetical protein
MAHARKQIRDHIITLLTGLTTTGSNVFVSRVYPLNKADLPGLLIYTIEEQSEPGAMGGTLDRVLSLAIDGVVKATGGAIDDTLDQIAEEVEAAITADTRLNDLALFVYLASTEIEFDGQAEQPTGIITMNFSIQYRT